MQHNEYHNVTYDVEVDCVVEGAERLNRQKREVVQEKPLTVEIKGVGTYTMMCTPCDEMALAVGFAFSEGLIRNKNDIHLLAVCPDDPLVIRMRLADGSKEKKEQRGVLIVSSCGICGSEAIEKIVQSLPTAGDSLRITKDELVRMPESLRERQEIFRRTGGTHAVGLIRAGEMIAVGEDIGRHNAFDKAVGKCILQEIPTAGCAAVLSGRVSFEMAAKAARAGVELIAAVSAPTTLAVEVARQCNITLCGFVRGKEATVYCHSHRITAGC